MDTERGDGRCGAGGNDQTETEAEARGGEFQGDSVNIKCWREALIKGDGCLGWGGCWSSSSGISISKE